MDKERNGAKPDQELIDRISMAVQMVRNSGGFQSLGMSDDVAELIGNGNTEVSREDVSKKVRELIVDVGGDGLRLEFYHIQGEQFELKIKRM